MIKSDLPLKLFASTPKGLELLLVDELRELGATDVAEKLAGVVFTGNLEIAYKACLWSRLANRILFPLTQVSASTPEELYSGVQTIEWDQHLSPSGTLNVNFITSNSKISHTLFGAQKVKDAIVDQLRLKYDERPNVARENADVCVHIYLKNDIATISLDLSGESLHKRGYRLEQGAAPLKENLAAAILIRAGWKKIAKEKGMLLDPMCGSGTLLIEGAFMAGNIAPGLLRTYFGFLGWKKHDAHLWERIVNDAQTQRDQGLDSIPTIVGYDADPRAITIAFANIDRAGMHGKIHVEKRDITACTPKESEGLFVVNPPYGERLGDEPSLQKLYPAMGSQLKNAFKGFKAAVFTGNPELAKNMGIRARKHYALFNGAIPCQLLLFDVEPNYFYDRSPEANNERRIRYAQKQLTERDKELASMFANRIRKNLKNLKPWADQEDILNYRIYDADLPEYAVAVDFYNGYICVNEYPAPKSIDYEKAAQRLQHILAVLPEALDIPPSKIYLRDSAQSIDDVKELYETKEDGTHYLVNLCDSSLEVGLAVEQRHLRPLIQKKAHDKHVLNLFSRSGALTVCAAKGGARSVKSLSQDEFHLAWTQKNLDLNGLSANLFTADLEEWLQREKSHYDLIFAELPQSTFYLSQDYPEFLSDMLGLLTPEGELFLITRDQRFRVPDGLNEEYLFQDLSKQILPFDFSRNPKIQQCWQVSLKSTQADF